MQGAGSHGGRVIADQDVYQALQDNTINGKKIEWERIKNQQVVANQRDSQHLTVPHLLAAASNAGLVDAARHQRAVAEDDVAVVAAEK